jgi:hypothetical protein
LRWQNYRKLDFIEIYKGIGGGKDTLDRGGYDARYIVGYLTHR